MKMWDVATAFVAETLDFDLGRKEKDEGDWKNEPATPQQLVAAADWLTDYFFRNGYEVLPEGIPEKKEGEDFESHGRVLYREQMLAMSVATRTLLASPNFYHINLTNHSHLTLIVAERTCTDTQVLGHDRLCDRLHNNSPHKIGEHLLVRVCWIVQLSPCWLRRAR